jgi:superkiller protein 3
MLKNLILFGLLFYYSSNSFAQQHLQLITDAVQTYKAGNTAEAIKLLNQANTITPNNIDAKLILGQIYIEINQAEKAKNILTKALKINKDNLEINYALGVANFNLKNFKSAITKLKKVLKLNSKHKTAKKLLSICYLNIGVLHYRKNKKENSIEKFKQAIKVNRKNIQAYKNLAVTLYEIGNKTEAERVIKKALKIKSKQKTLLKLLIQIYADKNRLEKALKPAEQYYKYYPEDVNGALQLAYLYRFNNQGNKAFKIYEKALLNFPDKQKIYDDYAELYKYRNKYDKAVDIYKKALKYFPEKTKIYEKIAEIYIEAKRYEDARIAYRNALSTASNISNVYIKIAKTFLSEKNKKKAIQIFEEGIKKNPRDWSLYKERGKVLEDTSLTLAISNYNNMMELDQQNPYPYIRLASIYKKNGKAKQSKINCIKAIELGTEQPLPYHILGMLYSKESDTNNSQKNEILAIKKSLIITSNLKSKYRDELKRNGGKLDFLKIEQMEIDSETMNINQDLLKSSLENLLAVSNHKMLEEKITEWRKAYPKNKYLLEYLGKCYEKEKKNEPALSTYKELIRIEPKEKEGHLGMARIMVSKGQLNNAILAYKRALTIDTKDKEIYKNLIYLSRATEKLNELQDDWKFLEKREPRNTILLTYIAKVLKIKNETVELRRVKNKLQEIAKHIDKSKTESNFKLRIK